MNIFKIKFNIFIECFSEIWSSFHISKKVYIQVYKGVNKVLLNIAFN